MSIPGFLQVGIYLTRLKEFRSIMKVTCIGCVIIGLALSLWAQISTFSTYTVDPARSRVEVQVFRGGLLKTLGHDHTIAARTFSGMVNLDARKLQDSSVSLTIESDSLAVQDPGASEKEKSEIQSTMEGPKVLNVQAFPKIVFNSRHVQELAQIGDNFDLKLTGRLKIHGIERDITFPARIRLENNFLRATGTVSIAQTDFGIVPITLGGGMVRVKDQVRIRFDFLAERASEK
jgi:polyisoprenoid-binding protein YceI